MKIPLSVEELKTLNDYVSIYTDLVPKAEKESGKEGGFDMPFSDWVELAGYIAAEANHAESRKIEKILDRIYFRIDEALSKKRA